MQPSTPNCQQILRRSLFRKKGKRGAFVPGVRAALDIPPGADPVAYAEGLLAEVGCGSREGLSHLPGLPRGRWIVVEDHDGEGAVGHEVGPILEAAILGMSGPSFYSPERPVVWTRERLTRAVRLHKLGGFYED